jgi:hypothetical protein
MAAAARSAMTAIHLAPAEGPTEPAPDVLLSPDEAETQPSISVQPSASAQAAPASGDEAEPRPVAPAAVAADED